MSDQLDVLTLVATRLEGLGISYMITGSLAASHYATPRFTRDIDIVVEMDPHAASRLAGALAPEFYVDEQALLSAVGREGMANIIHLELLVKVDLIVRKNTPYRVEEFRRRRPAVLDGLTIWFVAPEDLVLSKLLWMRNSDSEVQRRDVEAIVSSVDDLDRAYIDRWASDLGVEILWREVSDAAR